MMVHCTRLGLCDAGLRWIRKNNVLWAAFILLQTCQATDTEHDRLAAALMLKLVAIELETRDAEFCVVMAPSRGC